LNGRVIIHDESGALVSSSSFFVCSQTTSRFYHHQWTLLQPSARGSVRLERYVLEFR
jgi:hypothetical protein